MFSQSPLLRGTALFLTTTIVVAVVVFGVFVHKQRSFEQDVYAMQKKGIAQINKLSDAHEIGSELSNADYSATDVQTLTPGDLNKVIASQQIANYGAGLLEIPAISLTLPILEGMTQANLSVGAGTAKPDQKIGQGNFVLLGHYMNNRGVLFGGLRYLQQGNVIKVTYKGQKADYEVTETKIVHKDEGHYMEDSKEKDKILTLITCDSSREGTPNRLIVQARLKE